ncbi:hypothetical protein [Bacillus thuringiensis]|nr:hypothetical protein [Bacillus thuringiensis]
MLYLDGTTYKNPKFLRLIEEKLVKVYRVKVARIHEYISPL